MISIAKHGQFPGPGLEQRALNGDHVADIEKSEKFVIFCADGIFPNIRLELELSVRNVEKRRPAHLPNGHDPPGNVHPDLPGFEVFFGQSGEPPDDLGNGMGSLDFVRKGIDALPDELLKFLLPGEFLVTLFCVVRRNGGFVF